MCLRGVDLPAPNFRRRGVGRLVDRLKARSSWTAGPTLLVLGADAIAHAQATISRTPARAPISGNVVQGASDATFTSAQLAVSPGHPGTRSGSAMRP